MILKVNNLIKKRFSRSLVIDHLIQQLDLLIDEYGFDNNVGWIQVQGLGEEKNRAYGEFKLLNDLIENLGSI